MMPDSTVTVVAPPVAIPWYKSAVLRGLIAIVVAQLITKAQARYHINFSVFGLDTNSIVDWVMNSISGLAVAYAVHGRVTKANPQITSTQTKADAINEVTTKVTITDPTAVKSQGEQS
jgi:hypothetical protein